MKITVFTPAYNRAKTLPALYESLKRQTDQRFDWLIIDDGSTDETPQLIESYKQEGALDITYIRRENWGLCKTLNQGVELCKGDIFFRLDSDDYAADNAIERIYHHWHYVEEDEKICGLVFLKIQTNGEHTGYHPFVDPIRTNFFEYRSKYKGVGDRAEVVRADVMKKYLIPLYGDEKFCPEGLMWNRIAKDYDAVYITEDIYICEYMEGGLTKSVRKNLQRNAKGTTHYFSEIFQHEATPFYYVKNAISFWRYAPYNGYGLVKNWKMMPTLANLLGFFPGGTLAIIDRLR